MVSYHGLLSLFYSALLQFIKPIMFDTKWRFHFDKNKFLPKRKFFITSHSFEFQFTWKSKPNYSGLFQYQIEFKVKIELLPNILRDIHEIGSKKKCIFILFWRLCQPFTKRENCPFSKSDFLQPRSVKAILFCSKVRF